MNQPAESKQLPTDITDRDVELTGGLEPPQFSLRAMFWLLGGVGVALAFWQAVGPVAGMTAMLRSVAVLAHVAGNAIGMKLREKSPGAKRNRHVPSAANPTRHAGVQPQQYAPVTRLSSRAPLGRGLLIVTGMGALVGGSTGGYFLMQFHRESATPGTIMLGVLATAVLSGLWTFWMASLMQVFFGAWWEAQRHAPQRR